MKKLYSLFILSILALTTFVGCQMPTEDVKDVLSTTYRVNVTENTYKANVSVDNVTPKAGDTVVITITVPDDFSADDLKLSVMKGTETVTFTDEESTENNKVKKSFTMPASDVEVTVNFEKKATPTDDNGNEDDTPTDTTPSDTTPTETTPTETTPTDDTGNEESEDPVDEDDSKPVDNTPTVDADETTYGFTKTVNYTVVANGQPLPGTKTGAELIALAKEKNLVKDTDYTIDGTTVTLTASGAKKFFGNTGDGNTSSGGDTSNYTVSVPENSYITSSNSVYKLVIQNAPIDGYKKDDPVEILITNGNVDVNTGWGTPEGLYLVKVHIKEGETELTDIPVTVTKDHKIQFTMPDKDINVFAEFCDIRYERQKSKDLFEYEAIVKNMTDNEVTAVLCFNCKAYDNLEEVGGKYVFNLGDMEKYIRDTTMYTMYFTKLCDAYELSETGTLNDNQYTFGVITTDGLKILKDPLGFIFTYDPNAGLQSN